MGLDRVRQDSNDLAAAIIEGIFSSLLDTGLYSIIASKIEHILKLTVSNVVLLRI